MRYLLALFLFFITMLSVSAAADEKELLDIGYYKIAPHWIMGCNNLNKCAAIGHPNSQENDEQPWYVRIEWNIDEKKGRDFLLSFAEFSEIQSLKFCYSDKECDDFSGKIERISLKEQADRSKVHHFKINAHLDDYQFIYTKSEETEAKLYLKDFVENYDKQDVKYEFGLQGENTIYHWVEFHYLESAEISDILGKIEGDISTEDVCQGSLVLHYENGDDILFLCEDIGINSFYSVYRDQGMGYEPLHLTTRETEEISSKAGYGFVEGNGITGFFLNPYDQGVIHATNLSGFRFCDLDYTLAYNGENFSVKSINIMPFCSNILLDDWISIYQQP